MFYGVAVGQWGIQPTEFWKMCPPEFWAVYDAKHPTPVGPDYDQLLDELKEARRRVGN